MSWAPGRLALVWLIIGGSSLLGGLRNLPTSSSHVRVVPIVKQQMTPRLGDLSEDAGQELEGVDFFEPWEKLTGVVMRGFGSVENMRRAWAPLQSGQTHRGAKHVASDVFEGFALACGDTNGVIEVEAAPAPRQQKLDALVAQELLFFEQL